MKKRLCVVILVLALGNMAWGTDFSMSAGAGVLVGGHFTRYNLGAEGKIDAMESGQMVTVPVEIFSKQDIDQFNIGGLLFFDATWAEFSLAIQSGSYHYSQIMYAKNNGAVVTGAEDPETGSGWETMLGLSLLGKYPFELNKLFAVFPLAGIDYQIALRELRQPDGLRLYDRTDENREPTDSNNKPYTISAWNSLFVVLGGGFDCNFYAPFYLRTELLYSIRLQTPWEADSLEKLKKTVNAPKPKLNGLSSGPTLKVSVGWRFFG
jgi:hypothetical protein